MALEWDITGIRHSDFVCKKADGTLSTTTSMLIHATLVVGIGEITVETAPEFWARLSMYEKLNGTFCRNDYGSIPFSKEDVLDHIGLRTNVFPIESRHKWTARIIKSQLNEQVAFAKNALATRDSTPVEA